MLDQAKLIAEFDELLRDDIVFYDPNQRIELRSAEEWKMEFRITKALDSKPSIPSASPAPTPVDVTAIAGSDLSVSGRELEGPISKTHLLAFNKFCPYRPHFLLLTKDGFRRQWEALDIDDFRAVHELLAGIKDEYAVFYNCKAEAGCSRVHKHMQAIPIEEFDPWENVEAERLPYTCFIKKFDSNQVLPPQSLLEQYLELLRDAATVLGRDGVDFKNAPAHNMYLDRKGMMLIPRRHAGLEEVGVNTCGMLGMVWMANEKTMHRWMELSPHQILANAGVPPKQ